MKITDVEQGDTKGLPPALQHAQEAIRFPEVQEMLQKLSKYNLGIYMPHMHDEKTGAFLELSPELVQVEAGLNVSFKQGPEIGKQPERFLPVGWVWGDDSSSVRWTCFKKEGDTMHYSKCESIE